MLDTTTGRWMETDPKAFAAGDPNLYRYAGNDPVNEVDPSGLEAIDPPELTEKDFQRSAQERDDLLAKVAAAKRSMTLSETSLTLKYVKDEIDGGRRLSDPTLNLLRKVAPSIYSIADDDLKREAYARERLAALSPQLRLEMSATEAAIIVLMKQLDSDDYMAREAASKRLGQLTPLAVDYLMNGQNPASAEERRRRSELLASYANALRLAALQRALEQLPAADQREVLSDMADSSNRMIFGDEMSAWAQEIMDEKKREGK